MCAANNNGPCGDSKCTISCRPDPCRTSSSPCSPKSPRPASSAYSAPRPSPPCPRQSSSPCAQRASPTQSQPIPCSLSVPCEQTPIQQYSRVSEGITTDALPADQTGVAELHYTEIPDENDLQTLSPEKNFNYSSPQKLNQTRAGVPTTPIHPQFRQIQAEQTRIMSPHTSIQPEYCYYSPYPVQTPAELLSTPASPFIKTSSERVLPPHEGSYIYYAPTDAVRQAEVNQMSILPIPPEISHIRQCDNVILPIPPRPSKTSPFVPRTISQVPIGPEIPFSQMSTQIQSSIKPLQSRSPVMVQYDVSSTPVSQHRCYISTNTPSSPSPVIQSRSFLNPSMESTPASAQRWFISSEGLSPSPVIQKCVPRDHSLGNGIPSCLAQPSSAELDTSPVMKKPQVHFVEFSRSPPPYQSYESPQSTSATGYQANMGPHYFLDSFYTAQPGSPQLPRIGPMQFRTPDSGVGSSCVQQATFTPPQTSTPIGSVSSPQFVLSNPSIQEESNLSFNKNDQSSPMSNI